MNEMSKKRRRGNYEDRKNGGWYCMHRGWQDHPIFGNEPFSNRDAWAWMIEAAVFSDKGYLMNIGGKEVFLCRGCFSYALNFLAQAWGWHRSKVARFLKKLEKNAMIEINNETKQSIVTICNYNKHQNSPNQMETKTRMTAIQPRDKSETNRNKVNKDKKDNTIAASSALHAVTHASPPAIELKPITEKWKRILLDVHGKEVYCSWFQDLRLDDGVVYCSRQIVQQTCERKYEEAIKNAIEKTGDIYTRMQTDVKK